MSFSP